MTRKTLHKAALGTANSGADLSICDPESTLSRHENRSNVLKYLIGDCNIDINKRGDGTGDPVGRFGYWGTPLRYAASCLRDVLL